VIVYFLMTRSASINKKMLGSSSIIYIRASQPDLGISTISSCCIKSTAQHVGQHFRLRHFILFPFYRTLQSSQRHIIDSTRESWLWLRHGLLIVAVRAVTRIIGMPIPLNQPLRDEEEAQLKSGRKDLCVRNDVLSVSNLRESL
jgi:hypothetical protein